jgi:hypothetical protein
MAPKSIYNAYSTVSAFFRDAALEDLIEQSPCVLVKHQLGPKVDIEPEFRANAQFGRDELEMLISDSRIPLDRRAFYVLEGVAGLLLGKRRGLRRKSFCDAQRTNLRAKSSMATRLLSGR